MEFKHLFSGVAIFFLFCCSTCSAAGAAWSYAEPTSVAHTKHTATLLDNGTVLVAGGGTDAAEIFDPLIGAWKVTGTMSVARTFHTATKLDNGKVLVVSDKTAELYDPVKGIWTITGKMKNTYRSPTATKLQNGKVLVTNGSCGELYDPTAETWTVTGCMKKARSDQTAPLMILLKNGQVLLAGGFDDTYGQPISSAELYDPNTGEWTFTGSMNNARQSGMTATLMSNGDVMVIGGYPSHCCAELYKPDTGTWVPISSMNQSRSAHTTTVLQTGDIMVAGTQQFYGSDALASVELYNSTSQWDYTESMGTARCVHTATLLENGQVLVVGGENNNGPLKSVELYNDGMSPPASIVVTGGTNKVAFGKKTPAFIATGKDSDGNTIHGLNFVWSTGDQDDTGVAIVDPGTGIVTGVEPGKVTVKATCRGTVGTAQLIVLGDLYSIEISDGAEKVAIDKETPPFTAVGRDKNGYTIPDLTFVWSTGDSGDTGSATIGASTGIATGVKSGSVTILAIHDDVIGTKTLEVVESAGSWVRVTVAAVGAVVTAATIVVSAVSWYRKHVALPKSLANQGVKDALLTSSTSLSSVEALL